MFKSSLLSVIFVLILSLLLSSVNGSRYPMAKDEKGNNFDEYQPQQYNDGYNGNELYITLPANGLYFIGSIIIILLVLNVSCLCYSNCLKNRPSKHGYAKVNRIAESDDDIQCLNV